MIFAKKRRKIAVSDCLIVAFMVVIIVITLYPMYYAICASFSDARGLLRFSGLLVAPLEPWTLQGYELCFRNPNILQGLLNSLFYLGMGTVVSLILTVAGAYIVSKTDFLLRNALMKFMLVTMFFSGGLIPLFFVVKGVGIYNTRWAMILPYAISTYNLIVMRSFFINLPGELEESALLDGANDLQILLRIVVPLSAPVIAVITMYYAVGYWNSWYPSLVFQRSREMYPLQMILREMLILNEATEQTSQETIVEETYTRELVKYCVIIITTAPILVVYPFLQRYFVKGVMIGAIKG